MASETENKLPKEHLSFTQFNYFSQCPALYKMLYKPDGASVRKETSDMIYGSFMHRVYAAVNLYIKNLKDKDSLGVEDIEKIYAQEFKGVNLSLGEYHTGWSSLEKYALETFTNRAEIMLVEEELRMELVHKDQSVILLGVVDRVDAVGDTLKIIDYKLSPQVPAREDVRDSLQLNIYAYMLRQLYPGKQIFIEQYSILAGRGVKEAVDAGVQAKIGDYMIDLWQKMLAEKVYAPKRCNYCKYCPQVCDIYKEYMRKTYEAKGITTLEAAVETYQRVKLNCNLMTKEKDNLNDYIRDALDKANGMPLQAGENILMLEQKQRKGRDIFPELICKDCKAVKDKISYYTSVDIMPVAKEGKAASAALLARQEATDAAYHAADNTMPAKLKKKRVAKGKK